MTDETIPATPPPPPAYPVDFSVEPQLTERNRLTVGFRLILAIPHLLLVGGPGSGIGIPLGWYGGGNYGWFTFGSGSGAIGVAAGAMSIVSWFAIVFTGRQPRGLWDFTVFYMRWRANAIAYTGLLRDEYPPFSDSQDYPAKFYIEGFPETRDRWSVGLRLLFVIPHAIVLLFVGIAAAVVGIIAWFAILFTGSFPAGLYDFIEGYNRWATRVQAYTLLMRDEYPPFSLK